LISKKEIDNGVIFNHELYSKVRAKRREQKKPVNDSPIVVKEHELLGKKIFYRNEIYTVENVYKEFYFGWFYKALVVKNGSHTIFYVDNESCLEETIINKINNFKKEAKVID